MSTICRVQYLFLSCRTCGLPHFRNTASQILNQMMTECADASPTQGTTGSAKFTPNSNCFASQLSCSQASSRNRCSLISLTCLSLYLTWQRLRFWVYPSFQLLVSARLKSAMSTQGARGKESIHVTTFRVGKILKWTVPLFFLPPSLPIARCPWFCKWVEEKGDEVTGVHSHCTQGCSRLSSCLQGNITPSDNRRQKEASKWIEEEWEEGREERGEGNKERKEGIMVRR